MGHNKTVILITVGLLLFAAAFFLTFRGEAIEYRATISNEVKIAKTWKLPGVLKEVSGIAFLEPNKIACVQDERGIIFIYDLVSSSIVKQIEFAGPGDYEGITLDGTTAYVLKSDGTIYKVEDFLRKPMTQVFETPFGSRNDVEGLYFDPGQEQLLLVPKGKGLESENDKGIHVVNVETMEMNKKPLINMTFKEEIFHDLSTKDKEASFYPSEVIRHPGTGKVLVLEATRPHLLILDPEGDPEALHRLDPDLFPKPEGLTFDPSGNLYISNEGNPATIHRITLTSN